MLDVILMVLSGLLAGLLVGSFLNVCIYRWPNDLSIVRPSRSFCPGCEATIAWYDNVPLLSFARLGGKCRACQARIPWRYPLVELLTGLTFALCVWKLGLTLLALKYCVFSAILIALMATDVETRILPDEFTQGGIWVGLAFAVVAPLDPILAPLFLPYGTDPRWLSLFEAAFGAAFSSGSIWFVGWMYEKIRHREGLGFGDVKLIAMAGAFLGLQGAIMTLLLGSLAGSILGLAYIKLTRQDPNTYELPFGTFLGAAALVLALYAQVWKH